jgi:hypothetical protein
MMIRRFCRPLFSIFTTDICSVSPVCVVAAAHSLLFDLGDPAETARTYRDKPDVIRIVAAQSYHRLFASRFVARGYSRTSGPQSGTRRGLTRALRIGPVTNQAAPTRPPQAPEHRMRRNTCPTVLSRP